MAIPSFSEWLRATGRDPAALSISERQSLVPQYYEARGTLPDVEPGPVEFRVGFAEVFGTTPSQLFDDAKRTIAEAGGIFKIVLIAGIVGAAGLGVLWLRRFIK